MNYLSEVGAIVNAVGGTDGLSEIFVSGPTAFAGTEVLIAAAVIGGLIGFFGLKIMRVLTAICGLVTGAAVGTGIALAVDSSAGLSNTAILGIIIGCALVVAILFTVFRRAGAFLLTFLYMSGALVGVVPMKSLVAVIIILVVSLICAVVAAIYVDSLVIISTAFSGGTTAGTAIAAILGMSGTVISYVIIAGIVLVGMIVQFMMQSRKIGRKEKAFADKYREEASVESEVEKAKHMIFDDEDDIDMPDDEDEYSDDGNDDIDIQEIEI